MNLKKKMIGQVDISRDLVLLLVVGGLYFLSIALSNTFVNVYLWKQSGSYQEIGLYNLAIVIMQPLTFILAGKWAKRIDRVIVLRLGVSSLSFFFVTVLLMGDHAGRYILLLGGLLGVGFGFFWLAFNVLTFEITEPETRDFFNGFQGLLSSLAGMIGPISAGAIIASMEKYAGYKTIFSLSLGFFCITVILSFFLKRRAANGTYSFRRIIKERKNSENWKSILHAHFFQGIREGTFAFVIVIWVFVTTKSALALGTFGLVQSAVSFAAYYLATRLIRRKMRKKAILAAGIVLYIAVSLILFHLSFPLLIAYAVVIAIAYPVLLVPYMSLTYDVIGKSWKAAEMRIEYIVVRELYYNSGRVVSIALFLILVILFNERVAIPILMAFLGAGHLLIYFCIRSVNLKKDKTEEECSSLSQRRLEDGESGSPV